MLDSHLCALTMSILNKAAALSGRDLGVNNLTKLVEVAVLMHKKHIYLNMNLQYRELIAR